MLKEYLAEAISLLTEAVLGKPTFARAGDGCIQYYSVRPIDTCPSCGSEKRHYKNHVKTCCDFIGCTAWIPYGSQWCDYC